MSRTTGHRESVIWCLEGLAGALEGLGDAADIGQPEAILIGLQAAGQLGDQMDARVAAEVDGIVADQHVHRIDLDQLDAAYQVANVPQGRACRPPRAEPLRKQRDPARIAEGQRMLGQLAWSITTPTGAKCALTVPRATR